VQKKPLQRPIFVGLSPLELDEKIQELYYIRLHYYQKAHIIIPHHQCNILTLTKIITNQLNDDNI